MNIINNYLTEIFMRRVFFLIVITIFPIEIFSQNTAEAFKTQGMYQMQVGRYGEAIELLNRYIAAFPQRYDGYHLRGLCHEKREQYEQSVYDLKTALKLSPSNGKVQQDLDRVIKTWHAILYNKIEGHKREIAIDPSKPVNYLEIGKCYNWLGQFALAEQWYDEYLKREEASADEVIRYTLILQKTGHIEKGEKILKRYVEKYPNDHRLWSRYGYFTLWLGKTKIAIEAFQRALVLRPFFKEAEDGLRIALGKGYVYTINDTSYRPEKQQPRSTEYPIDRYYRILRTNPGDDETRFTLINDLMAVNRLEEAYQQLQILQLKYQGQKKFDDLWQILTAHRDSVYTAGINKAKDDILANPLNKDAVKLYAEYCANLERFDEALLAYENYFNLSPDEADNEMRFRYAQLSAWNKSFQVANEQIDILISKEPGNIKYQLLASQIYSWQGINFEKAKEYLNNVLNSEPNNFEALIAMGSVELHYQNFEIAQGYVDKANTILPNDPAVTTLQSRLEFEKLRAEEERLFLVLEDGRKLAMEADYINALSKYNEYLSKAEPNRTIQREYADVKAASGDYSAAIDIYNQLLSTDYDFETDLQRAKVYYWMGDSVSALSEFQRIAEANPEVFEIQLYLGDSYTKMHKYNEAKKIYDALLDKTSDTSQIAMIETRMNWLPVTGLNAFLSTFPAYLTLYPDVYYFEDNTNYVYNNQSLRAEIGAFSFLTFGFSAGRGAYKNNSLTQYFSQIKGGLYIRIRNLLIIGAHFGRKYYRDNTSRNITDGFIRTEKDSVYLLQANYNYTDAAEVLYSAALVGKKFSVNSYQLYGWYKTKSGLKLSGNYNYMKVSDGNKGEVIEGRLGKYWEPDFIAGYEYSTTRFARKSTLYYSPAKFESHSIWLDWDALMETDYSLTLGGKIGLIPADDFILTSAYFLFKLNISENIRLQVQGTLSNTSRETTGYSSRSIVLSAVWQI
jgi:tetratricopeptide (TPR) repeat protein